MKSKNADIFIDSPDKMFTVAVEKVLSVKDLLKEGLIYRGEYLKSPHHNALTYDRVPKGNIALFDIEMDGQNFLSPDEVEEWATRLGMDTVPTFYYGDASLNESSMEDYFSYQSKFGTTRIEGIVIKNYDKYDETLGKVLMAKFVRPEFKEVHAATWGKNNPGKKEIVQTIIDRLKTDRRWEKAIEHLRDDGCLDESPKDIGPLIKEVQNDIKEEESDMIKDMLFRLAMPQIERACVSGLPDWYKARLNDNRIFETIA